MTGFSPAQTLPSGTVTFVFTDIEGSTQRWDRNRAAMEAAVRRHDEILREAIDEYRGRVFKTIGDAFCAAFARPEDAVTAMLAAVSALGSEAFSEVDGLRIRCAIHTGTADERDADYFGPAVNRVARLLAVVHGGQIVLSTATAELVRGSLGEGVGLRDLGSHRLRDLSRPEHVYQLIAPDLPDDFPPLRSLDAQRHNLPLQSNSFVGRDAEIQSITALVEEHRLVTLVGSGGVGKTRVSLQVASNVLETFPDGVWLVELAPLTSGDFIASAIARALGTTLGGDGDSSHKLARALKSKRPLLVLDNCEHVIATAADVAATLLHQCPGVKILASSRQPLDIAGEETFRMPSLEISTALALFVDRARSADKRFVLTEDTTPAVLEICRRLDGIPLAIELAAARTRMLTPVQLRDQLDARFRVLTGGSRDVLPRQQTLRALIDWSYELLDERERALFRRLGIFANAFTLDGAIAVGGEGLDVFSLLSSLIDKSLVLAEPSGDVFRYRLLESTRAYASEKLEACGEREHVANLRLDYLRGEVRRAREPLDPAAASVAVARFLDEELEDVRSALDTALKGGDACGGAALLADIGLSWLTRSLESEAMSWNERFVEAIPEGAALLRARLLTSLAHLLDNAHRMDRQIEVATEALKYARISGDGPIIASALDCHAEALIRLRRLDEAQRSIAEADALPDTPAVTRDRILTTRALLCSFTGDLESARVVYERQRTEARTRGMARAEHIAAVNLAETEHALGHTGRAVALLETIAPIARSGADKMLLARVQCNLAAYLVAANDLPRAREAVREVVDLHASQEQDHALVAMTLEHFALLCALEGDPLRAAKLEGYADSAFRHLAFEREFSETLTYDRLDAILTEQLEAEDLARLKAEGAALTPEGALALARAPAGAGLDIAKSPKNG